MADETTPDGNSFSEFFSENLSEAYNRLKRLQQHHRSNIPAMMANRAMSTFSLHREPLPPQASQQVEVIVYPQDPFVGEPEIRLMSADDIRSGLINSRVEITAREGEATAQPDKEGNYLYWPGSPEFDQVNAFYYTTMTLRMYERYAERMIPWSFPSPRIIVNPHFGNEANAFYNEQERLLGFHTFQLGDIIVNTAQSADIISHEAAHAVLDGLRDLYNESFGLGPSAFHESFGDMTAMLVALHDDSLLRKLLELTKGDLKLDNFVTAIAEHLTDTLTNGEVLPLHSQSIYLRNALNEFRVAPFDELPFTADTPENTLSLQPHNYSRLFTGAFYDLLLGVYEKLNDSMSNHIALHRARDIAGRLMTTAVELGPVGEFDFQDMALAFIAADELRYDGEYFDILKEIFATKRGFATPEIYETFRQTLKALPDVRLPETLNSALAAALFLEETVIPALNLSSEAKLIPMSTYRNARGDAFLTYFESRSITLEGEVYRDFNGARVDLFGGLTLAFDGENRLRSALYRPVTDEDTRQVKKLVELLISQGRIIKDLRRVMIYFRDSGPHGLILADDPTQEGGQVVVKDPVHVDHIPQYTHPIRDYMRILKRVIKRGES